MLSVVRRVVVRPWLVWSVLICGAGGMEGVARAQVTPLGKQLARLDLGVSAAAEVTRGVSGTTYLKLPLTQNTSTTVGVLVTLRYVVKPLVGFEANYGQARYTEQFSTIGGVQTTAKEYTLGYVAHTRPVFGFQPFLSAGAGTIAFTPTLFGGQGLLEHARAAYYYSAGIENPLLKSEHFGYRLSLRQLFFLAPDFHANYLNIHQRTFQTEPTIGFFVRY